MISSSLPLSYSWQQLWYCSAAPESQFTHKYRQNECDYQINRNSDALRPKKCIGTMCCKSFTCITITHCDSEAAVDSMKLMQRSMSWKEGWGWS